MHRYKDISPARKTVPQWMKYTGLIVLFLATVAVVGYGALFTP